MSETADGSELEVTLRPTQRLERLNGTVCRLWEGRDNAGVPVIAWVKAVLPQAFGPEVDARYSLDGVTHDAFPETAP